MAAGAKLKGEISKELQGRRRWTPCGHVKKERVSVCMGSTRGNHVEREFWCYRHRLSGLEMVFGFYESFYSDFELACKVITAGDYPQSGEGPSVQFNGDWCPIWKAKYVELRHQGLVTCRRRISREKLFGAMKKVCPREMELAGIDGKWPLTLGSTEDIPALIDRLFEYAFCIGQAKLKLRRERLLPCYCK